MFFRKACSFTLFIILLSSYLSTISAQGYSSNSPDFYSSLNKNQKIIYDRLNNYVVKVMAPNLGKQCANEIPLDSYSWESDLNRCLYPKYMGFSYDQNQKAFTHILNAVNVNLQYLDDAQRIYDYIVMQACGMAF
jgi:hypothetical protein